MKMQKGYNYYFSKREFLDLVYKFIKGTNGQIISKDLFGKYSNYLFSESINYDIYIFLWPLDYITIEARWNYNPNESEYIYNSNTDNSKKKIFYEWLLYNVSNFTEKGADMTNFKDCKYHIDKKLFINMINDFQKTYPFRSLTGESSFKTLNYDFVEIVSIVNNNGYSILLKTSDNEELLKKFYFYKNVALSDDKDFNVVLSDDKDFIEFLDENLSKYVTCHYGSPPTSITRDAFLSLLGNFTNDLYSKLYSNLLKIEYETYKILKYSNYDSVKLSKKFDTITIEFFFKNSSNDEIYLNINDNSFGFWLNINYFNTNKIISKGININLSKEIFLTMIDNSPNTIESVSIYGIFWKKTYTKVQVVELPEDIKITFDTPDKPEVWFLPLGDNTLGTWVLRHINNYLEVDTNYSYRVPEDIIEFNCSTSNTLDNLPTKSTGNFINNSINSIAPCVNDYLTTNVITIPPLGELNKNKNEKETNKNMNMFNLEFGPVNNENIGISMYGISIRNKNGKFVSYDSDTQKIIDVEIMNISNGNTYIYKMPVAVKDIKVGDVVSHMSIPMIVTEINGENNKLTAIDPFNSEEKTILPITNIFHFDYVIKYVSFLNNLMGTPSEDQPFGNMLPYILLSQTGNENSNNNDLATAMILSSMGNSTNTNNMLPLLLMSGGASKDNLLVYYMIMNSQSNNQ